MHVQQQPFHSVWSVPWVYLMFFTVYLMQVKYALSKSIDHIHISCAQCAVNTILVLGDMFSITSLNYLIMLRRLVNTSILHTLHPFYSLILLNISMRDHAFIRVCVSLRIMRLAFSMRKEELERRWTLLRTQSLCAPESSVGQASVHTLGLLVVYLDVQMVEDFLSCDPAPSSCIQTQTRILITWKYHIWAMCNIQLDKPLNLNSYLGKRRFHMDDSPL